jgi:hypothetical protein
MHGQPTRNTSESTDRVASGDVRQPEWLPKGNGFAYDADLPSASRAVDIEAAASMLPSLKPEEGRPEASAATETDGQPISEDFPPILPYSGGAEGRSGTVTGEMTDLDAPTSQMRLSPEKETLADAGRD